MFRKFATAAAIGSVLGTAVLTSPAADARERVVDRRGVPPVVGQAKPTESFAIQGGWRVKCVIPFCSHDFNPSRERSRDHRTIADKKPK
jgi:hypothetical protein